MLAVPGAQDTGADGVGSGVGGPGPPRRLAPTGTLTSARPSVGSPGQDAGGAASPRHRPRPCTRTPPRVTPTPSPSLL